MTVIEFGKIIGVSPSTAKKKLSGEIDFKLTEMLAALTEFKTRLKRDFSLDYLFSDVAA